MHWKKINEFISYASFFFNSQNSFGVCFPWNEKNSSKKFDIPGGIFFMENCIKS